MTVINLYPTINHCIETVTRREYEQLLREMLARENDDRALASGLEILFDFLQTAEFSTLRAQCDMLFAAGHQVVCTLARDPGTGRTTCIINQAR